MTTDTQSSFEVAERFFAAISAADMDAVRACYAPDARVWHNTDGIEQDVDQNLRLLSWVARNTEDLRYEEVRRQATETGFIQQHVFRGASRSGTPVEIPAVIVAAVQDGRIIRIDEYVDSAATTALFA